MRNYFEKIAEIQQYMTNNFSYQEIADTSF